MLHYNIVTIDYMVQTIKKKNLKKKMINITVLVHLKNCLFHEIIHVPVLDSFRCLNGYSKIYYPPTTFQLFNSLVISFHPFKMLIFFKNKSTKTFGCNFIF